MFRRFLALTFAATLIAPAVARAQGDFAPPATDTASRPPLKPLPAGVILVPGAIPSASDSRTPLPELGRIVKNVYSNRYFDFSYAFPADWIQEFDGPPPSESGTYVLAEITPPKSFHGSKGSILVTAQDLFFSLTPSRTAADKIHNTYAHLPAYYKAEREPMDVIIGDRRFTRFDYTSPVAGLHWYVLATEIRCHAVEFTFTGGDTAMLDQLVNGLKDIRPAGDNARPPCVANYARNENVIYRVDPVLTDRRFNPIPVRVIIGKTGKVEHVHVISAFADQAKIITDALVQWRFRPYVVNGEPSEVETGILFGSTARRSRQPGTASVASD